MIKTFHQIPYKVSNDGNATTLENGKIKFKREGVYLFITTMGITISSDNNGYYDLELFYNNYQNGGIIDSNVGPNKGYIGRYNFINVIYCKKDDVVDARIYSNYAERINNSSHLFIGAQIHTQSPTA